LAEFWSPERKYEPHVTLGRMANRREREDALKYATEVVPPTTAKIHELVVFRLDGPAKGEIDSRVPLPENL
jgi:2'-5' RNA ligase